MAKTLWDRLDSEEPIPATELTESDYIEIIVLAVQTHLVGDSRLVNELARIIGASAAMTKDLKL